MEQEFVAASDTSKARPGYLSLLGYSVFGYVEGLEESAIRLDLHLPEGWPLLPPLAPRWPLPQGRDSASARNFYALADSQIVAGPKLEVRALGTRPPAYFALYAEGETDIGLLRERAEQPAAAFGGSWRSIPCGDPSTTSARRFFLIPPSCRSSASRSRSGTATA